MYIKLPLYLFYTLKIHTMILMWSIPVPGSILTSMPIQLQQNPFFPYNKSVWGWEGDEREKLLLMSIKLPMYLFYTSNKISLIFLCRPIPYTFLLIIYVHKFSVFYPMHVMKFMCTEFLLQLSMRLNLNSPPPSHLPPSILNCFVLFVCGWVRKWFFVWISFLYFLFSVCCKVYVH